MVGADPDTEIVIPMDCLDDLLLQIQFTFKALNIIAVPINVSADLTDLTGWNKPRGVGFGQIGVGDEKYCLYDVAQRTSKPATDTVENPRLTISYSAALGGVPATRGVNNELIWYKLTWIDFDSVTYALVDLDTFEADLEDWTKVDEVGATVLDRSQLQVRNGAWAMRHSAIDNADVAYLTKSFVIGAVSKAYIRVPVFFEVTDQEKVIFEIITDAADVVNKRTQQHAIAASPAGDSKITGMWLYLGAEIPVDGTYEVRLRATCESGAALEIFYDDIKVVTKA